VATNNQGGETAEYEMMIEELVGLGDDEEVSAKPDL